MRLFLSTVFLFLAAGPLGCESPVPITRAQTLPVASGDGHVPGLTEEQMAGAVKLHITKCARCHKLYSPETYTNAEWQRWMAKMAKKAKLNPEQQELLLRYGQSLRNGP